MPKEKAKPSERTRRHSEGDKRRKDEDRTESRKEKSFKRSRDDLSHGRVRDDMTHGRTRDDLTHGRPRHHKEEEGREYRQKKDSDRVLREKKDARTERGDMRYKKEARTVAKEERVRRPTDREFPDRKGYGRDVKAKTAEDIDRKFQKEDQKDQSAKRKGRPESEPREVRRQGRETDWKVDRVRHKREHKSTENHANMEHNGKDTRAGSRGKHHKEKSVVEGEEQPEQQQQMEWQGDKGVAAEEQSDPQEVPRKGFFYEHDNRDTYVPQRLRPVPPWRSQMMERNEFFEKRRFLENPNPRLWREREEQDWGRGRDARDRIRRHSSGEQYPTVGRGSERRRGPRDYEDWEDRESSRMELVSNRWGNRRRRVDRREEMEDRWRQRSPARWRHDLFEEDEPTSQQAEGKTERRKTWSSEMDGVWAHDKYEELIDMETETEPVPT